MQQTHWCPMHGREGKLSRVSWVFSGVSFCVILRHPFLMLAEITKEGRACGSVSRPNSSTAVLCGSSSGPAAAKGYRRSGMQGHSLHRPSARLPLKAPLDTPIARRLVLGPRSPAVNTPLPATVSLGVHPYRTQVPPGRRRCRSRGRRLDFWSSGSQSGRHSVWVPQASVA